MSTPRPAVFLDRDGTLNRERGYVTDPADLELLPGVVDALRSLRARGFTLVVITNQGGIARGLYDENVLTRVHERLHRETDGVITGYFHCPHHPDESGPYGGPCRCRKPASGLVETAIEVLGLDPSRSFVVGDSARDLACGAKLPVRTVLVQSGKPWRDELAKLEHDGYAPDHVTADLCAATTWILSQPES